MDETAVRTSRSRVHVGDPILTRGRYATCDTRGDSRVDVPRVQLSSMYTNTRIIP